jgi:hypothetical protein
MRTGFLFLLSLAACNKGREVAVATSEDCSAAMERTVKLALEARKKQLEAVPSDKVPPPPEPARAIAERAASMKTALVGRCVDDRWSAAVVRCFQTANSVVDCERGLGRRQLEGYRAATLLLDTGSGSSAVVPEPPKSP